MNEDIKVLCVEKSRDNSLYQVLSEKYFTNIVYAQNQVQALELFQESAQKFELVVSDMLISELNSLTMLKKMKSLNPNLYTIFISESEEREELLRALELNIDRYVLKPIDFSLLDFNLKSLTTQILINKEHKKLRSQIASTNRLMHEYKKAVDESTIFSIGDLKGKIIYANKQFREVSGYSLEELVGQPHSMVRDPDMPKEAFAEMWKTIRNKEVWKGMVTNRRKDGEPYYVNATIVPILDDNGGIVEYAGIRDDVTKLVLKEQEVEKLKNKQRVEDVQKALEIKTSEIISFMPFASIFVQESTHEIKAYNEKFSALYIDASFLDEPCYLKELLIENENYIYDAKNLDFFHLYELSFEQPIAGLKIDDEIQEFFIGISPKDDGYLVSFVPKS